MCPNELVAVISALAIGLVEGRAEEDVERWLCFLRSWAIPWRRLRCAAGNVNHPSSCVNKSNRRWNAYSILKKGGLL